MPEDPSPQRAVIYCRVSSTKQAKQGHGLDSQELRCRQHADSMGYHVEAVFPDDVSGGGDFMKRPGMVALLSYLDAQPNKDYIVIFDDLKRFARDTEFHIRLRRAFKSRGARIECLSFKFEDTPEGKFIETVLAAQGELEREQNGRQVVQKMRARVLSGYWCFAPVTGYRYDTVAGHGKMLVRKEPEASIVTEVFQSYASRRLESLAEVKRFLEDQPTFPRSRNGEVHFQRVIDLLTRSLYAGYIDVPKWGIALHPAKHEPLIDFATWSTVQDRMKDTARAPTRKDINEDFPMRGFVSCGQCGEPLTACWSTGRNRRYPYYLCDTKGCPDYRKSIRKEAIEGEFEKMLSCMTPQRDLFLMVFTMLEEFWDHLQGLADKNSDDAKRELREIERKTDQLMERVVDADSPALITAYEDRIRKLERRKLWIKEKITEYGQPAKGFKETYRTAMEFLANPCKLWASERLDDKRLVLRLAFARKLPYLRNEGYRTAETTLPFKVLAGISSGKYDLVEPRGVEPLTS
ncbi:recombinase family protein [Nitratireductor alexandrii]|uniref:recombinase family protein n=1 Tax=Nitratireductor alexandrii TaxID=2448161 RepID=UPI000FD878AF